MRTTTYLSAHPTVRMYLVFVSLFFISFTAQSQDHPWVAREDNEEIKKMSRNVTKRGRVYYRKEAKIKPGHVFGKHRKAYGLTESDDMKLTRTVTGELGKKHYRYQQFYKGICVEDGQYLVHVSDDSTVISSNGHLAEHLQIDVKPKIREDKALDKALKVVDADRYAWQDTAMEHQIKLDLKDEDATYYPKGKLVIVSKPGKKGYHRGSHALAYKFDITSVKPFKHIAVYVDAKNGKLIKDISLMHSGKTGSGNTLYNGTRSFEVEKAGLTNYRLFAGLGSANHHTKASSGPAGTAWWLVSEYKDNNGHWGNGDRHATSAHWAAERSYRYYSGVHNRGGVFNGYRLRIHARISNGTAFYNQANGYENIYVENGWSTLDVIGHEYTHGVVRATANLIYQGESGALNESFADIFGVAIERHAGGGLDWTMGEDRTVIRSLQNPRAFGDPDTYMGANWFNTASTADNGGVHTNSGVQNRWFFLLVNGGNQNGVNVAGIGFDNAMRIVYRNLAVYLTNNSNYADARDGAIDAAEDLFGACSAQVTAVTNAWAAVGVGTAAGTCVRPLSISMSGSYSLSEYQQGSWTANASGGTGTYTYRWSMRTSQTGGWIGGVSSSRTYSQRLYPGDDYIEVRVDVTSGGVQRSTSRYVYCNDCGSGGDPFYLSVYPNPVVTDEVNIEMGGEKTKNIKGSKFSLYNSNGERLYEKQSSGLKERIDTHRLPDGTYYIEVANKAGILRRRIYIKK